jgi:predicted nucleotidyltransferase
MQHIIQEKLSEIEREHNIKILYACESGSRGWEFPSPDSDYDVRFIYIRPLREYLSIKEKGDHLSFPINDELDIYGWDLRKTLQLIRKSNTTPFEWLQSPIVYSAKSGFQSSLWRLCAPYFSQRSNIHHYLGIAKGAMDTLNADRTIKIKKLFYILRPLLAALWCLERATIAPMSIKPLMALLPEDLIAEILDLIKLKETSNEGFLIKVPNGLMAWIEDTFRHCSTATQEMGKHLFDLNLLDDFFINTIQNDDTGT